MINAIKGIFRATPKATRLEMAEALMDGSMDVFTKTAKALEVVAEEAQAVMEDIAIEEAEVIEEFDAEIAILEEQKETFIADSMEQYADADALKGDAEVQLARINKFLGAE